MISWGWEQGLTVYGISLEEMQSSEPDLHFMVVTLSHVTKNHWVVLSKFVAFAWKDFLINIFFKKN